MNNATFSEISAGVFMIFDVRNRTRSITLQGHPESRFWTCALKTSDLARHPSTEENAMCFPWDANNNKIFPKATNNNNSAPDTSQQGQELPQEESNKVKEFLRSYAQ